MRALVVALQFVGVALEEMSPSRLSGFGALDSAFEKDYAEFLLKPVFTLISPSVSSVTASPTHHHPVERSAVSR